MAFYELTRPLGIPASSVVAHLREKHGRVIGAGIADFCEGPKDTVWLELKRNKNDFPVFQASLKQRGYPFVTGPVNKPIGVSFLKGKWTVSVSAKPGSNRDKYAKIDKIEFEEEFAKEIENEDLSITVGRSKNLFFFTFRGAALPEDFRQRLDVVGPCVVSKAKPTHYYYGPKLLVALP